MGRRGVVGALAALAFATTAGAAAAAPTVTFTVDPSQDRHAISPQIYGINGAKNQFQEDDVFASKVDDSNATLVRLGGDNYPASNWEIAATNLGANYCFQNAGGLSLTTHGPGDAVTPTIDADKAAGRATMVTIPIGDHVAADRNEGTDGCNGDVTGGNGSGDPPGGDYSYLTTRFDDNHSTSPGAFPASPDTGDHAVYEDEYVHWLLTHEPDANLVFTLDNEPDIWSGTHKESHPPSEPLTYENLTARELEYATRVKQLAPNAKITGPALSAFEAQEFLHDSDYDQYNAHNQQDFTSYFLTQLHTAEQAAGHKLIDDFDVHWYPAVEPQVQGLVDGDPNRNAGKDLSHATDMAREQAPRSLWDPTYVEPSHIPPSYLNDGPIDLLHRIQSRIDAHAPGTGIAITEWNYGGGDDISGAVTAADVLGIFGKYGVDVGAWWAQSDKETWALHAFRAFTNYDGAGSMFNNTSVRATNSDTVNTSVYASVDKDDPSQRTIVAINKRDVTDTATIQLQLPAGQRVSSAQVWTITRDGGPSLQQQDDVRATGPNTFTYPMPAQSVSVIVPVPAPAAPKLSAHQPPRVVAQGTPVDDTFTASGTPAPTFAVSSGTLPDGLSLGADGHLTGTPTALGSFTFTVRASNGAGAPDTAQETIDVAAPAAPTLVDQTPPGGTTTQPYRYAFAATGAPTPTFTVVAGGTLPGGLSLSEDGVLSGVPTATGAFHFKVRASNGQGTPATTVTLTVTIGAPGYGSVWSWGNTGNAMLGNGPFTETRLSPLPVTFPSAAGPIAQVAMGGVMTLARTTSGDVYAWGHDVYGALGIGDEDNQRAFADPQRVAFPAGAPAVTSIAATYDGGVAATADGNVWTWGGNLYGTSGNGTNDNATFAPAKIDLGAYAGDVASVAAGIGTVLARTTDGHVLAWGYNHFGTVGNGSTTDQLTPTAVQIPPAYDGHITAIAIGGYDGAADDTALALTDAATGRHVLAWGANALGQVGNGTMSESVTTPVEVKNSAGTASLTDVAAIGAGQEKSYAETTGGTLLAWGDDGSGELGDGGTTPQALPVTVGGTPPAVTALSGGIHHSLAVAADGHVLAWGQGYFGQLGSGTQDPAATPTAASLPAGSTATGVDSDIFASIAVLGGSAPSSAAATNQAPPVVEGTGAVGQTLACLTGDWTSSTPVTFTYQWERNGSPIAGADGAMRTVTAADAGSALRCAVTAHNAGSPTTVRSATIPISGSAPANSAPTADFGFAPATPETGQSVSFDATTSTDPDGDPLTYAWDFGDGSHATGATPAHAFASAGNHGVTVTVDDGHGHTANAMKVVVVHEPAGTTTTTTTTTTTPTTTTTTTPTTTPTNGTGTTVITTVITTVSPPAGGGQLPVFTLGLPTKPHGTSLVGSADVAVAGSTLVANAYAPATGGLRAAKRVLVASTTKTGLPAGPAHFRLKLSSKAKKAQRKLGKLKLTIEVTVSAPGRAPRTVTSRVTLTKG